MLPLALVLLVSFATVTGAFMMPRKLPASFKQPNTKIHVRPAARPRRRARRSLH